MNTLRKCCENAMETFIDVDMAGEFNVDAHGTDEAMEARQHSDSVIIIL